MDQVKNEMAVREIEKTIKTEKWSSNSAEMEDAKQEWTATMLNKHYPTEFNSNSIQRKYFKGRLVKLES